ncbi:MAG: hypothetical protein ACKVOI_10670 [Dongiaceae bacterium]
MNPLSLMIAVLREIVVPQQDDGTGSLRTFRKGLLPVRITEAERWFIADVVAGHVRVTLFLALGAGVTVWLLQSDVPMAVAAGAIIAAAGFAVHRRRMRAIQRRLETPAGLGIEDQTPARRLDLVVGWFTANPVILPLLIAAASAALYFGFHLDLAIDQIGGSWIAAAVVTGAWRRFLTDPIRLSHE